MADIDVRRLRAIDGVAPQHKKAGEDEFEFTEGSGGALHTKDVDVLSELESIKQQQQQILHQLDEPIDTQLTGSRVEEVVIVDALAITDNTTRFFTFNAEKYTSFYIYAINSLDSPVNITPYEYHNLAVVIWDESTETFESVASIQKSIPANRAVPLMDTPGFKRLKGQGAKSLRIRVKPDQSPTTGSLSIIAWGVVI